jgi:PKD repeat protein
MKSREEGLRRLGGGIILLVLLLVGAASAAPLPLSTTQSGTISGDLYVGAFQPVPWNSQPSSPGGKEFTQTFSIPAFTNVQWARLEIVVYAAGTDARHGQTTVKFDGNGDGTYDTTLGVEDQQTASSGDGEVYTVNGHSDRCYSDYRIWYDVTSLITTTNPGAYVKTEPMDGSNFDGRVKEITLVVAYNDGDADQVKYWVNTGHDYQVSGDSGETTTFDTSTVPSGFTAATLRNVALSSKDAQYTFNTLAPTGANPVLPYNFFETNSWDVTGGITAGSGSTFGYTNNGGSFKTTLATLTVRNPGTIQAPVADFDATPLSGMEPLTVAFTDKSSNTPTSWLWEFRNATVGWTQFATTKNPSFKFAAGSYDIRLTATNAGGPNMKTMAGFISVTSPPLPTLEITLNPSSVTLSGMISGQEATGQSTVTATASNGNSWSVAASDGKATNKGFMVSGITPLGSALQLGKSGTAYQPLTSDYTSFMQGSSMGTFTGTASLKQPISAGDPLGTYAITVTFTGAIS